MIFFCTAGQECVTNIETNEAKCECVKECPHEVHPRRMVCSNHNETFKSDCELHQLRCFCEEGFSVKCPEPDKYKHSHIEYYGKVKNTFLFKIKPPRIFLINFISFFSGECRTIPE